MPLLGATGGGSAKGFGALANLGYFIRNSLRFTASASANLQRTPASATNRKTWTWSAWVKRGTIGSITQGLFMGNYDGNDNSTYFGFSGDQFFFFNRLLTVANGNIYTTQVFRDISAWYHIVVAMDTTQATAANRFKLYVNGTQVTSFAIETYPTQNTDMYINSNVQHNIGFRRDGSTNSYFDGYLAEINFIDGQALTPSSFGKTDAATNQWIPKKFAGTYGTNGFYLKFADASAATAAAIGKDSSPNGNNWTPNNISVTAGATYDAMTDSPTLTSATVANYCVLSPLAGDVAPTNGNLSVSGVDKSTLGTVGVTSGKWYFEMTCVSNVATTNLDGVGIATRAINTSAPDNVGYLYRSSGVKLQYGGSNTAYGASFITGDVIGVAYDADAGTLVFYKNNVSQGTAFTGITGTLLPVVYARGITSTPTLALNFGQQPFTYTPPTGFKSLNTYNL